MSGDKTMLAAAYQDASNNLIALRSAMRNITVVVNSFLYASAVTIFQICHDNNINELVKSYYLILLIILLLINYFHIAAIRTFHIGIVKFRLDLADIYRYSDEPTLTARSLYLHYKDMLSSTNIKSIESFLAHLINKSDDLKISNLMLIIDIIPILITIAIVGNIANLPGAGIILLQVLSLVVILLMIFWRHNIVLLREAIILIKKRSNLKNPSIFEELRIKNSFWRHLSSASSDMCVLRILMK